VRGSGYKAAVWRHDTAPMRHQCTPVKPRSNAPVASARVGRGVTAIVSITRVIRQGLPTRLQDCEDRGCGLWGLGLERSKGGVQEHQCIVFALCLAATPKPDRAAHPTPTPLYTKAHLNKHNARPMHTTQHTPHTQCAPNAAHPPGSGSSGSAPSSRAGSPARGCRGR